MAKTIQETYNAKVTEMQTQSQLLALQPQPDTAQQLLSDVASPSKVANWRLVLWVTAVFDWITEVAWEAFKKEVQDIADSAIPGTAAWLVGQAKAFQLGYQLQWINNKFQYSSIDVSAQIVKYAAIVESGGQVICKVATETAGNITPLSASQLAAFTAYFDKIKYAGVSSSVISNSPDDLKVIFNIYYDPLVLDANGELLLTPGVKPAEDAVKNYLKALPFNGVLDLNKLTDEVQKATGVVSPFLLQAQAKIAGSPSSAYATITDKYLASAGYLTLDTGVSVFTYTPHV